MSQCKKMKKIETGVCFVWVLKSQMIDRSNVANLMKSIAWFTRVNKSHLFFEATHDGIKIKRLTLTS